jgi:hypothetical protein
MTAAAFSFSGLEVSGPCIRGTVEAFRQYPQVLMKHMRTHGLVRGGDDQMDFEKWYSMEAWVSAMHAIVKEVGASTAYTVGRRVPEFAALPPTITDVVSSLCAIDAGYHLNHRRAGVVMFDPSNGTMLDGIGHYACTPQPANRTATMVCDNPYPCDFDRGIIAAFGCRFEPTTQIAHEGTGCRKKGQDSCTYVVSW